MSPRGRRSDSFPQLELFQDKASLTPSGAVNGSKVVSGPRSSNGKARIELNDRQREAVEHVHGPMLVVAGAGTGKTTVLTQRIARLIRDGHASADEILAITYTDNAAAELLQRVARDLGPASKGLKAKTFHAYCYEILQRCGRDFKVVEPQDLWVYLRRRLSDLGLKYYTRAASPAQFLDALLNFFDNCHDELKTADDYENYVRELEQGNYPLPRVTRSKDADKMTPPEVVARCVEIAHAFRKVEDMLAADGLGTFAHMILRGMQVLRSDPAVLAQERKGARFILIDEFQDSNLAQIELAQLLAGDEGNLFVVGDPDQAIYRFRGASSAAFEEFVARFPDTKAVVLDRNQRSTSAILNCAHGVIANNPAVGCRLGKAAGKFDRQALTSARERRARAAGTPVTPDLVDLVIVGGNDDEAADIAGAIEQLLLRVPASDDPRPRCAVLYRSHSHRAGVVKELAGRGVPFRVEGLDALQTCEVRDLLACVRSLQMPPDNASLFRVAAMPVFHVKGEDFREALRAAGKLADVRAVLEGVRGGKKVIEVVDNARAEAAAANWNAAEVVQIAIKRFGVDPNAPPVVALRDFVKNWSTKPITTKGDLEEFLEYMEYFPQAGGAVPFQQPAPADSANTVALMTVHAAKGLEFDHVFVIRANGNSFPTNYKEKLFEMPRPMRDPHCLAPDDGPELHKQEERRLFYVAMTRARDTLSVYARPGRGKNPRPTALVRELMDAHVPSPGWRQRQAKRRVQIQAAAAEHAVGLGAWFLLPPSPRVLSGSLSATAIERYKTCPLQFKISRDWNVPGEVAASLQFGAAVHTALKDFYDAVIAGRPRSTEELLQIFEQALAENHFDDEHQQNLYRKQGREQLRQFFEVTAQAAVPDVFCTERSFELLVGGVRVRGRIDRIDRIAAGRVAIVDYKTGAPKDEMDARKSLQLSIYALAARDQWQMVPEELIFYNLQTNEPVSSTRTDQQLRNATEEIIEVAAKITEGNFEPTPGFHCRSCAYSAMCPATEERLYTVRTAGAGV